MIQFQTAPVFKPTPACGQNVLGELADALLELAFAGQTANQETLELLGFSPDDVEKYGARATALARRRSIRRIERYI